MSVLRSVLLGMVVALFAAAPVPAPMSAQQILSRMSANTAGLQTYEVPIQIDARIQKLMSQPVSMNGTRYFKAPDKGALRMNSVPSIAKGFQNVYASLGSAATWPHTYDITLATPLTTGDRPMYGLRAVYKRASKVDHILLDVDANTFDPVTVRWFYTNGATIVMKVEEQLVDGKYRLPSHESLDVSFPQYRGHADVRYGSYVVNKPIPDSVFSNT
jgi:hypothetical protein